jgi:hypothetical protein
MLNRLKEEQPMMIRLAGWAPAGVMDEAVKKEQHDGWKMKVLRMHKSMGRVLGQIESVNINVFATKEAIAPWIGLLERAASEPTETKDCTTRVESNVARLRTVMADGNAKVEQVQ